MLWPTGKCELFALEYILEDALVLLDHINQRDVEIPRRETNDKWSYDQLERFLQALWSYGAENSGEYNVHVVLHDDACCVCIFFVSPPYTFFLLNGDMELNR